MIDNTCHCTEGFFALIPIEIRKEIWKYIKDDKTFARASRVNRRWKDEMEQEWKEYCSERGHFSDISFSQHRNWKWVLRVKSAIYSNPSGKALENLNIPCTIIAEEGCYEGDVLKGRRHGYGKFSSTDGRVYVGHWKKGAKEGCGTLTHIQPSGKSTYSGEWKNDVRHGRGIFVWPNGDRYEGLWKKGLQWGKGVYTWSKGCSEEERIGSQHQNRYIGEWKESKRHGRGTTEYAHGGKFVGNFKDDERSGIGTFHWPEGGTYHGIWKKGGRVGCGIYISPTKGVKLQKWNEKKTDYNKQLPPITR
eukprot:TRINITY_DN5374_c0_g1_i3.p1 TRINITY_DN5374_c0_g1~~TRINITY_DN5374_c0_g1_i3.p1  ORF type:complete len:305 (+),score=44.12 TRINITY_DN5374_c0_g1_i3:89-1003(+)